MRRWLRHVLLATGIGLVTAAAAAAGPLAELIDRLSVVTAWICTLLFVGVLLIGPLQAIRYGRVPINHLLRRDLGIWTALTGLAHFVLGTRESMNVVYLQRFVEAADRAPSAAVRDTLFTWGSLAGFVVGLLVLMLLGLSNNGAIRLLGTRWWKRLQRSAYIAFALTIGHGLAFQVIEGRGWFWIGLLAAASITIVATQIRGVQAVR